MKLILLIISFVLLIFSSHQTNAQGLINDNAYIYLSNSSTVYINGSTGHYTNQNNGRITSGSTDTIKLNGNWTNNAANVVLTSNNGVVSFIGSNQTIGGTNSTSFNSLYLSGSGTKTLNVNTTVGGGYASPTGILNLTSLPLDLNSKTLTVTNPAAGTFSTGAIRYTTGYILSEQNAASNNSIVLWKMGGAGNTGNHIVPFGVSGGVLVPVTFRITTSTNSDISFSTRRTINTCGANPAGTCNTPWTTGVTHMSDISTGADISVISVIDRWWQISASAAATADITFTYQGVENTTNNPTGNFKDQRWINPQWQAPTGFGSPGVTTGTGSITDTAVTAFGTFVLSLFSNPLPVTFVSFEAACVKNGIHLTWTTASEINNDYFTIEKSTDGNHFEIFKNVAGVGNSTKNTYYELDDDHYEGGNVFYKISQTDFDGISTELKVLRKSCSVIDPFSFIVYPNPGNGSSVKILISGIEKNEKVTISCIDAIGKTQYLNNDVVADETGKVSANLVFNNLLSEGLYSINVYTAGSVTTRKVLVKN